MAPKVTLNPVKTPTQEIVEDANRVVYVEDALGRRLGVRKVTHSIRRRVVKAISADQAGKPQYMGMVMLAAACCEIDGDPVRLPSNEIQFDALIDRLDEEGSKAIGKAYQEHFMAQEGDGETAGE